MASPNAARIPARIPVRMRATAGMAATAVVVVVAGCATVPSGGAPQQVNAGGNQVQAYLQQLPPPGPKAYHEARNAVLAFLHASATYAIDPGAARQFLLPQLRGSWRPVPGPITVLSSTGPLTTTETVNSRLDASNAAGQAVTVEFTGQRLATVSQTGQYQYSPGTQTYRFALQQGKDGVWRISALPPGRAGLLLTQDDFANVYQARNLFFFARQQSAPYSNLVPDPVYVADSALNTTLASELVKGLLSDQPSWLSDATQTAFPRSTRLGSLAISGQTAVVDLLGAAAADASTNQQQNMAAQLQATLGSTAYSPPLARFVQLEINGRAADTSPTNLIDNVLRGPLVYQSGPSSISEGLGSRPLSLGPAEFGSVPITAIALNPANSPAPRQMAVAAADGNGCQVYLLTVPVGGQAVPTGSFHSVRISTSGGKCTSLSWDSNGYLWAAAGQKVWVLQAPSYKHPLAVALPANLPSSRHRAPQIIALRMAPDAVRAALLIKSGAHNRLLLAAVRQDSSHRVSLGGAVPAGTGLRDPKAMSWYSPYDLIVLDDSAIIEVPLAGGAAERLSTAPPGAVSLTTDGVTIVVGTVVRPGDYQIWHSKTVPTSWAKPVIGANPIYPG